MAILINDMKSYTDDALFKYEDRLNSEVVKFLDRSPTFVTYYHVNNHETSVDEGFRDIEAIISNRSPLRFQKITNFPLYGLEQIVLSLQDTDQGLDSDYSGEAVILPNTIKPFPNDFFMIDSIKGYYIFRITEIFYDTIRPDNFYKVVFRFEYLSAEKAEKLEELVHSKFTCLLENIGTENQCIISDESMAQISLIDKLYNDMCQTYLSIFYNERYNCCLGDLGAGYKLFDPFQSVFINKHKLLNKKNNLTTIILSEGFADHLRAIKYERTLYRFFETQDMKRLDTFPYYLIPGDFKRDSLFARYYDKSVKMIEISVPRNDGTATHHMIPKDIVNSFRMNGVTKTKYVDLLQKFARSEEIGLFDIPLDLNEELLSFDGNIEIYRYTPILLYIIKQSITNTIGGMETSSTSSIAGNITREVETLAEATGQ